MSVELQNIARDRDAAADMRRIAMAMLNCPVLSVDDLGADYSEIELRVAMDVDFEKEWGKL